MRSVLLRVWLLFAFIIYHGQIQSFEGTHVRERIGTSEINDIEDSLMTPDEILDEEVLLSPQEGNVNRGVIVGKESQEQQRKARGKIVRNWLLSIAAIALGVTTVVLVASGVKKK